MVFKHDFRYGFFDFSEENCDTARVDIRMLVGVVNENAYLFSSDLLRSETEDKEERVDYVRFSTTVWSYNGVEALLCVIYRLIRFSVGW